MLLFVHVCLIDLSYQSAAHMGHVVLYEHDDNDSLGDNNCD